MTEARHIALRRTGAGPRILLLHGWSMTGAVMAPLADRLAGQFEVLSPDLPGHGETRGFTPDLAGAADWLDALLEGGPPTLLVGWSLGALIGWQRLARDASGLTGMVSLDMSPRPASDWTYGMNSPAPEALTGASDWPSGARTIAQSLFAPGTLPSMLPALTQIVADQDAAAMARFWTSLQEADCRGDLARIELPLLAIHGTQSRIYSAETARWIVAQTPNARAHLLDGAGHAPHLEYPEITADLVARFAQEVLPR